MRKTCLKMVYELAKEDPRVVFIGSDLGPGTLDEFKEEMPDRFFMEGVSEQNIVGMAAGLAMDGFIPYVNTIATFITRRACEQVSLDLCLQNLPVRLIGNGGGMVYAPLGPTHMAVEDISLMRTHPNMTVLVASDADEMRRLVPATVELPGPAYIRLGKGGDPVVSRDEDGFAIGRAIERREPGDLTIITTGPMLHPVLEAADLLEDQGVKCGVIHAHTVKPLDVETIVRAATRVPLVVTVEEHLLTGGLGSAVLETMADHMTGRLPEVLRLALPDAFPANYGSREGLLDHFGLNAAGIASVIEANLTRNSLKAAGGA